MGIFIAFTCQLPCFAHLPQAASNLLPKQLQGSHIVDDRIGSFVPLDIGLTNHMGQKVTLQRYFNPQTPRPIILTLGYYRCPMLCNFVMGGLVKTLQEIPLRLGKDYTIVSVSIDPKETFQTAASRRESYVKTLAQKTKNGSEADWHFHVTTQSEAQRLAQAVGFGYQFDKASGEYAHGAGLFIIAPNGKLNRVLYGVEFPPSQMKLALTEASSGTIGRLFQRIVLSCFHYDPSSHRYGIYIFGITRALGSVTVLILVVVLLSLRMKERFKRKEGDEKI